MAALHKKIIDHTKDNAEKEARREVLEELFYDINRSRVQIYKINFVRGIFFGFGSVLGGTLLIALLIWLLSALASIFPPIGDFFNGISHAIQARPGK